MDIPRKTNKLKRNLWRTLIVLVLLGGIAGVTVYLSRLKPADPSVDPRTIVIGKVQRGEMLREVRGVGTLVPEDIYWVTSEVAGQVRRMLVEPGAEVKADTALLELSNPDLELEVLNAESQLKSSESQLTVMKGDSENAILSLEATIKDLEADYELAQQETETTLNLFIREMKTKKELRNALYYQKTKERKLEFERSRLEKRRESEKLKVESQESLHGKTKALYDFKKGQLLSLTVRAGVDGVLEEFSESVGIGKKIGSGGVLAKVSDPTRLEASLKIPESQARDVLVGMPTLLEVLNQEIPGRVNRIDPAVREGSVEVDIALEGDLPQGARPDLSVTGVIEIERLEDVIYVDRPVSISADSAGNLFKIVDEGTAAIRIPISFGRLSAFTVELVEGLSPGDEVIISDMSQWDEVDRLRLK